MSVRSPYLAYFTYVKFVGCVHSHACARVLHDIYRHSRLTCMNCSEKWLDSTYRLLPPTQKAIKTLTLQIFHVVLRHSHLHLQVSHSRQTKRIEASQRIPNRE